MSTTAPAATDLESRVESRKQQLISEIIEHKKNSSRSGAAEEIDKIKERLTELAHIVKEGVVDGWSNINPRAKVKLDDWLAK